MKTDTQIREGVFAELRWDPSISESEIGVSVRDGVVTISGNVVSFEQKLAAERAAEWVRGVRALADELKVKLPTARERSDTEIAHAARDALKSDTQVPHARVKVRVENGWLWLEGNLEWQFEKEAAARAVRDLTGVKGVTNAIRVKPTHLGAAQHSTPAGAWSKRQTRFTENEDHTAIVVYGAVLTA
jgi:osmotically-inducible protein OsmY